MYNLNIFAVICIISLLFLSIDLLFKVSKLRKIIDNNNKKDSKPFSKEIIFEYKVKVSNMIESAIIAENEELINNLISVLFLIEKTEEIIYLTSKYKN